MKTFMNEMYSKPPKKKYATNQTNFYHTDDTWSFDLPDLKDYVPEKCRGYRYVLLMKDKFSRFGWTLPLKNKDAQSINNSFDNI